MKNIVYIHGVGRTEKATKYSLPFQDILGNHNHIEFSWQHFVESWSDDYFSREFPRPPVCRFKKLLTWTIRRLLFEYALDAVYYPTIKDHILVKLHNEISKLKEVTFICHSIGCLVAFDYMVKYGENRKFNFITMGCNLPLFKTTGYGIPASELNSWHNFYESNDVLGMPIKSLAPALNVSDIEFKSSNMLKSWNVAAHNSYWKSEKLAKKIKRLV